VVCLLSALSTSCVARHYKILLTQLASVPNEIITRTPNSLVVTFDQMWFDCKESIGTLGAGCRTWPDWPLKGRGLRQALTLVPVCVAARH
jgi:hypothetical protein